MNEEYYGKMKRLIEVLEKKEIELRDVIDELKKPGIIDILDREFGILLKKLKKCDRDDRELVFNVIEPIIRRKMKYERRYDRNAVDEIIRTFKIRMEIIVEEKIGISFIEILDGSLEEYKSSISKMKEIEEQKAEKKDKIRRSLISVGEMFVAGGFIATDYKLLSDSSERSEELVVALLGTIFAGGVYFVRGIKEIEF